MPIKDPQRDLPAGLRGGSDAWDQRQASAVLRDDYFTAAVPPPSGGMPLDVVQLAPILEQFGTNVSTPFPAALTAGNDVWAMVQAPGTNQADTVTVQGVAGELVHSDFRDVASGTFTYNFYVWRNVSGGAASLAANRAAATTFNLFALETTPGGTLGQTFYTNANEGAVPLPISPDGSLAIAALRSDGSTGLTGTAPTVATGGSGQWDYGLYEEMATGTGNTLQWTKTSGGYRSVKGIIVEPPAGGSSINLAAAAVGTASAAAALALARSLQAAAIGEVTGTAQLASGVSLAAIGLASASASASMAREIPLGAAAAAVSVAGAQLAVAVSLQAAALVQASGSASLQVNAATGLSANAQVQAAGSAVLSVAIRLAAGALAVGSAQATLLVDVPIAASALAQASGQGVITVTAVLRADAVASASGSAQLLQGITLSGAGLAVAGGQGALTVVSQFAQAPMGSGFSRPLPLFVRPARLGSGRPARFTSSTRPRR